MQPQRTWMGKTRIIKRSQVEDQSEIKDLHSRIEDLFVQLQEKNLEVEEKERTIKSLLEELEVADRDNEKSREELDRLSVKENQLHSILNSRAWRWVCRYGRLKNRYLTPAYALFRSTTGNARTTPRGFQIPRPIDPYDSWLEVNQWNARRESVLRERLSELSRPPLLSVVMPVYNPPIEFLNKAIQSVVDQVYRNWELCIADDASTDPAITSTLKRWADQDTRIRVTIREENENISRASNSAAELASGDYLILLDQDDELTPDALGEVALYLADKPETDLLYSDDDKIDSKGRRYSPQFKPDWSPELLLSYMYFSHLFVIRSKLFFDLQGLRVGFEGSQDYDLALRASEKTKNVGHIPKILYHWRALPTSTASSASTKPESFAAGLRAVQDAFERRGIQGVFSRTGPSKRIAASSHIVFRTRVHASRSLFQPGTMLGLLGPA